MKDAVWHGVRHLLRRTTKPEARQLVLSLISEKKALTSQELYKLTVQHHEQNLQQEGTSANPEAAPIIPSMRYMKAVVLQDLLSAGKVEKVHAKVEISEEELEKIRTARMAAIKRGKKMPAVTRVQQLWRWQLKAPQPLAPPSEEKRPFGAEVGVGADWSHLNKRRQRARMGKVARDVGWMKELEGARREARRDSS